MKDVLVPPLALLAFFTVLLGAVYPALTTAVGRVAFPSSTGGSLLVRDGRTEGSALIGQPFSDPGYFWGRPSATEGVPYEGRASGGSNLGPSNPALREAVLRRIAALRAADPSNVAPVPVDLVTASASGLDPHVSPAAAWWQVERVARARGLPADQVRRLVAERIEGRTLGFLGEPRVNVLLLNLALDARAR